MSYVDELLAAYRSFVALPWDETLPPPQRVWMAVYPPEHERRLRLHLAAFEAATIESRHAWACIDVTTVFEDWMATHPYRDAYFEDPELLETALPGYFEHLVERVREQLADRPEVDGVVALLGAGALFGLGDAVKVSALVRRVDDAVAGRLLLFFPGDAENNNVRLLDARDGWDYMAVVIKPGGAGR